MKLFLYSFLLVSIVAILGAILETFFPGILTKSFQDKLSALTIASLGITFSILFLMIFLKGYNREGFQDSDPVARWTSLVTEFKVGNICKLYTEIYEKTMTIEKGAPPETVKTDAQAREATDAMFQQEMTVPLLSCSLYEEVESQKENQDTFFTALQKVPDIFLIQVVETAQACRTLLIRQVNKVQQAEAERKEGFMDLVICSDKAAKERKTALERKPLSEEAQKCMLVEEIPAEQKQAALQKKLDTILRTYETYKKTSKIQDSLQKILDDCAYYKQQLDKKKQEAEEMSNKYDFRK